MKKRERLLYSPDNKEKLERGIMFLWSKYVDDTGDIKTLSRHWNSVLTGVLRFVPWLFWVYLFDIPVSISGKIFVWADIGKSIEFMNWIQSWMEWEFEEFHQENVKKWNIPIAQNILRNLATILRLDSGQEANLLAGKFDELSKEFKELIASYVEFRLIPDLMTLQNASYNSFEQWFLFFWTDPKYKKWEKLIEMLEKGIEKPGTKSLEYYLKIAREVLGLLKEEWQVDSAITPTENRNNFFEGILKKDEIFGHLKWLLEQGLYYQSLSILFFTTSIDWINQFWVSGEDKGDMILLYNAILNDQKFHLFSEFPQRNYFYFL